jgi:hypothetical protein
MVSLLVITALFVNHTLTPGALAMRGIPLQPLTVTQICNTKWGKDARHVSKVTKIKVYVAYGIPVADRHLYVIDHLIAREVGGADTITNLWPEERQASYVKDEVEGMLHRAVCRASGPMPLADAQQQLRSWARE